MKLLLEIAKTQAVLNALIECEKNEIDVDELGVLYVLKEQLDKVDAIAENL